ncbi:MAG: hypothetical protein ACP5C4_06470 [Methanomicrobiales archaeon]
MPVTTGPMDRYAWLMVPALAFGGILLEIGAPGIPVPIGAGGLGCVAGSVVLAVLALKKPKKDLVSLFVPMFAVIIFVLPSVFETGLVMQVLFALTLAAVAYRLEVRFSDG